MTNWDEIKRLAADFQKVQLSSTAQRLSERNCIEIVSWLIEKKLINLIFTSDGKEYLTPAQLIKDIEAELYASGGRINLVDLAKAIGVDLAHINLYINDVLKGHKDVFSVLGQLIDKSYILKIAGEINEKLTQHGQVNISDLTIHYDLPAEFLQQQIEKQLGKIIQGKQDKNDPRLIFTESFIEQCIGKIRGALAAITKPTSVASILNHVGISEKLFFSLFDQASPHGLLTSRLHGAQYIPAIYTRSQNTWVNEFYKQNGYLEFDALARLGITDYKTYIKKQLANEDLSFLNSCVVSKKFLERIELDVVECISSKSYIDLQNNLPSVLNDNDVRIIVDHLLSNQRQQQAVLINNFILSKAFIDNCLINVDTFIQDKAKQCVESGSYQIYQTSLQTTAMQKVSKTIDIEEKSNKRDERRKKAAGGKSGGGTQGRETKTKSTKKLYRPAVSKDDEEDDSSKSERKILEIISNKELQEQIRKPLEEEGLDELIEPLATYLLPEYQEKSLQLAHDIYQATVADRTANRRQTHNELQNKLNDMIGDIRLYEKGIKLFPSDLQPQLYKYLLKTICTDVVSEILNYVAMEQHSNIVTNDFNTEQRLRFVEDLPAEFKTPLLPLVKSLSKSTIDDFMEAVENSLSACSMIIKKIDKKKDRIVVLNHKHSLLEQLNTCDDLALTLHLAVLAIFSTATQCMLHASGKHVAGIVTFLKPYLKEEHFSELSSYHDFVALMLSGGSESENAKEKLKEKIVTIRNIANEYKKMGTDK